MTDTCIMQAIEVSIGATQDIFKASWRRLGTKIHDHLVGTFCRAKS
jgi:hypothetical protein